MAGLKPVRVLMFEKGASEDNAADTQIVIDMVLNPETGASKGPFPAFGRLGNWQKPETLYPFAMMMDGRIDYGTLASDEQNGKILELRPASLKDGVEVAYGSQTYVIQSVTSLSGD